MIRMSSDFSVMRSQMSNAFLTDDRALKSPIVILEDWMPEHSSYVSENLEVEVLSE